MPTKEQIEAALDDATFDPTWRRKNIKGCLYGEFGSWKTVTAARCAKSRGLIIAVDDGWESLRNHPGLSENSESLLDNFEVMEYRGLSQLDAVAERVDEGRYKDFDIILLDTVSQMQEEYLDFIMDHVNYGGKYRDTVVLDREARQELGSVDIPAQADYHVVRNKMRPVVKKLIKANINIFFLAHVREPSPLDTKKVRRPALTDAVYKLIARECNLLGFCEKKNKTEQATITFEGTTMLMAKSRIGLLNDKTFPADEFVKTIKEWNA